MLVYQRVIRVVNIDQNIRVCKWLIGPRCQSFDYILFADTYKFSGLERAKELGVLMSFPTTR